MKKETIEEYLARGGKITICPPQSSDEEENKIVRSTASNQAQQVLDLGEGEIMYGEKIKKTRKKPKKIQAMDQEQVDLLPDSLKHLANRS